MPVQLKITPAPGLTLRQDMDTQNSASAQGLGISSLQPIRCASKRKRESYGNGFLKQEYCTSRPIWLQLMRWWIWSPDKLNFHCQNQD